MTKFILTDADVACIDRARRTVSMVYATLPAANSNGAKIAALRTTIMHYTRGGEGNTFAQRILLEKLCSMWPNAVNDFIVTYNVDSFLQLTPLKLLLDKYTSPFKGFGNWGDNKIESVIYALSTPGLRSFPAILHVETAELLVRQYSEQEKEALKLAEDKLPERIGEDLIIERNGIEVPDFRRIAERAEALNKRADSRAACYRCGAIKPRKRGCTVCGYVPRVAQGG